MWIKFVEEYNLEDEEGQSSSFYFISLELSQYAFIINLQDVYTFKFRALLKQRYYILVEFFQLDENILSNFYDCVCVWLVNK